MHSLVIYFHDNVAETMQLEINNKQKTLNLRVYIIYTYINRIKKELQLIYPADVSSSFTVNSDKPALAFIGVQRGGGDGPSTPPPFGTFC